MTARGLQRMEEACDALKSMLRVDPGNPFAERHLKEWETALTARRRPQRPAISVTFSRSRTAAEDR